MTPPTPCLSSVPSTSILWHLFSHPLSCPCFLPFSGDFALYSLFFHFLVIFSLHSLLFHLVATLLSIHFSSCTWWQLCSATPISYILLKPWPPPPLFLTFYGNFAFPSFFTYRVSQKKLCSRGISNWGIFTIKVSFESSIFQLFHDVKFFLLGLILFCYNQLFAWTVP